MIILEDNTGQRMEVKEGQRYNGRKWHVVDSKPPFNNEPEQNEAVELLRLIEADLIKEGIHWGSVLKTMLKPVALLFGKRNCLSCDVREVIINSARTLIRKLGKLEAAETLKSLIRDSFLLEPAEVLKQLKAILDD